MRRFLAPAASLICCVSTAAFGWNATGHEAVAQVALDQLTQPQRDKLVDMLKAHVRYDKDLLYSMKPDEDPKLTAVLQAATWPDFVKSPGNPLNRTENHGQWHYVDYPYDRDGKTGPEPVEKWDGTSDPANLLQAMQKMDAELSNPATPADRKAIDLCWVLHLVGDIHQPLHAVSFYSNTYPDGDKGGNSIHVSTGSNPDMPLHAVWDNLEGTVNRNAHINPAVIRKIADRVEKAHPPAEFEKQLADKNVTDWARDSFELSKSAVYLNGKLNGMPAADAKADPGDVPALPAGYEADAQKVADRQVALAGYRLAAVLQKYLQ